MLSKNHISLVHLFQLSRFLNYASSFRSPHLILRFIKYRFLLCLQRDWFVVSFVKILDFNFQVIYKFSSTLLFWHQVDYIMNHIFNQDQSKIFISLQFLGLLSKFGSLNVWCHLEETVYPSHQWIFLKKCLRVLKEDHFWLLLKIEGELWALSSQN